MNRLIFFVVLATLLAACTSQPPATETPVATSGSEIPTPATGPTVAPGAPTTAPASGGTAYPPAATQPPPGSYPVGTPTTAPYPPPPTATSTLPEGPAFKIDTPINADQKAITGTGPANVPIVLVNITRNAEEVGRAVVGTDGKFSIEVSNPLPSGELLGLQIGDLAGTEFTREQFLRGPGYTDIPQLGIFVAQAQIE